MMNKNGFSRCGENYINRLRKEGRYSTAHVYKNALYSFSKFCGTLNMSFRQDLGTVPAAVSCHLTRGGQGVCTRNLLLAFFSVRIRGRDVRYY